ncbi:MAG: hypothetical protein P8I41_02680, partial [Flavobacteriaceae bacterium]|nr:hypothetical protein [Flavobacteriaceae bacterium]
IFTITFLILFLFTSTTLNSIPLSLSLKFFFGKNPICSSKKPPKVSESPLMFSNTLLSLIFRILYKSVRFTFPSKIKVELSILL